MTDDVWENFKRGIKPAPRKPAARSGVRASPKPEEKSAKAGKKKKFAVLALPDKPSRLPAVTVTLVPQPSPGDPALLRRLESGEARIEAKLDLHHMTESSAHAAVGKFIDKARRDGKRFALIVTGRGAVLRAALPRWLGDGATAKAVRFCHPAAPRHGGGGAFYVVLKR
ncbi:MAG: Smr/MutS family protein [Alphaproteobacteria bacterium]